jgi:hypothetical protein
VLRRIADVRLAADEEQSAYLLRTRLNRMLLSLQRLIASEYDLTVLKPTVLDPSRSRSENYRQLASICNAIVLDGRSLSQRSAALDDRWQRNWRSLNANLMRLEAIVDSDVPPVTDSATNRASSP